MITERITRYRCSYCRRRSARRKAPIIAHEAHCFRNPARVPWIGELTSAEQEEAFDGIDFPPWWPGPGKIWDGSQWRDVPGWRRGSFAYNETWPEFDGQLLPLIKPTPCRLALLFPASAVADPF